MEFFAVTAPGLEAYLAEEARMHGFDVAGTQPGGVSFVGGWPEMWRANLVLRGATRILVRLAEFPAVHLSQLDKRARKLPWADWLRPDVPIRVEATCRKSKIYHQRAAAERIERAVADRLGAPLSKDAKLTLKLRIERNLCTVSLDSSGAPLHQRGHKTQLNKAPLRETLAALFLRASGYDGSEPLYDPMCGSGTFPIEAAEIAAGMAPGRDRRFAFQDLASFDAGAFEALDIGPVASPEPRFFGSDRDSGAIAMSRANAARAGVESLLRFEVLPVSAITPPCATPGLVIANPPYGGRVGNKRPLFGLYAAFGQVLRERFTGWRVGLITSEAGLAEATGLSFDAPGPFVDHGGIKVRLWQAGL